MEPQNNIKHDSKLLSLLCQIEKNPDGRNMGTDLCHYLGVPRNREFTKVALRISIDSEKTQEP